MFPGRGTSEAIEAGTPARRAFQPISRPWLLAVEREGATAGSVGTKELLPRITGLDPDVLIVTGDHSTPALYREHSWHHVPTLVGSRWARPSAAEFGESACRAGDLGTFPGVDLMSLALAHAMRLEKYGA